MRHVPGEGAGRADRCFAWGVTMLFRVTMLFLTELPPADDLEKVPSALGGRHHAEVELPAPPSGTVSDNSPDTPPQHPSPAPI